MATDDSMSDDVFESEEAGLRAGDLVKRGPSPTGYRGYTPDPGLLAPLPSPDTDIPHKVRHQFYIKHILIIKITHRNYYIIYYYS